ncbi:hypothetical protein SELMODRAFT_425709 [Selaginella moellendorffii]|uniref:Uncharacterized protein n=1 Tax=Selaginella moellendorffii TaxID=88036 RepID=D8SU10_SELML|nr:hypothetical protein SELMODRAFT_425709 [Selaginella moellendorffii]
MDEWISGIPSVVRVGAIQQRSSKRYCGVCKASEKDQQDKKIEESRKFQLQATEVLAEILKSAEKEKRAEELVDNLNEEFFYIASTYLSMAKKEANVEVVNQVENALKAAMAAKDKTLRPEIRLFNKLLRDNSSAERQQTISENHAYLHEGSYFFELLDRMTKDVESQKSSPDRTKLRQRVVERMRLKAELSLSFDISNSYGVSRRSGFD